MDCPKTGDFDWSILRLVSVVYKFYTSIPKTTVIWWHNIVFCIIQKAKNNCEYFSYWPYGRRCVQCCLKNMRNWTLYVLCKWMWHAIALFSFWEFDLCSSSNSESHDFAPDVPMMFMFNANHCLVFILGIWFLYSLPHLLRWLISIILIKSVCITKTLVGHPIHNGTILHEH